MIPIAASYLREETKFTTIVCDLLDEGQDESLQLYSLLLLEKMREHGECIDTEWLTLKYLALDNNQTDVSRYYWLYIACACENFGQKL